MVLKGKVAIITGASKGIGKGIAERYAREGAAVVLASRSKDLLVAAAGEINASGGRALAVELDVTDCKSVESVVSQTAAHFGRLDILVNNAGISMAHPSEQLASEHWERAIRTDLSGLFYGCQSAARQMIAQGEGGCIINITSTYGVCAAPMRAAYCSSKAAAICLQGPGLRVGGPQYSGQRHRTGIHSYGTRAGSDREGHVAPWGHREAHPAGADRGGAGCDRLGGLHGE